MATLQDKEWELVQKRAFTHWINSYLAKRNEKIEKLEEDFKTGVLLISFLEVLTGKAVDRKYNPKPKSKVHFIENANIALQFLNGLNVKGRITISAEQIVDGNLTMMLGFCWMLLQTFRDAAGSDPNASLADGILAWVKEELQDYGLEINNFKSSFNDGKALLALCHKFNPGSIDYFGIDTSNSHNNAELAMKIAEDQMKIPPLLKVDALTQGKENDKSIILYLSLMYTAFKNDADRKKLAGVGEEKVLSLRDQLTALEKENAALKENLAMLTEKVDALTKLLEKESEEKVMMREGKSDQLNRLQQAKEDLKKARDQLEKDKLSLAEERDELLQQLRKHQRAKEELEESLSKEQKKDTVGVGIIRKNLVEHLTDLVTWKEYVEQERNYKSVRDLPQEKELRDKDFDQQYSTLAKYLQDENGRLASLVNEKQAEESKKKASKKKSSSSESESESDQESSESDDSSTEKRSKKKK